MTAPEDLTRPLVSLGHRMAPQHKETREFLPHGPKGSREDPRVQRRPTAVGRALAPGAKPDRGVTLVSPARLQINRRDRRPMDRSVVLAQIVRLVLRDEVLARWLVDRSVVLAQIVRLVLRDKALAQWLVDRNVVLAQIVRLDLRDRLVVSRV